MKSLGLESSTKYLSVALFDDDQLVEEVFIPPQGRTHSEIILPAIDQLLSQNKAHLSDIDQYFISQGPGAFTSLRVGMASLLAFETKENNACYYPISSLALLASDIFSQSSSKIVAPLIKAGRGRIYGAVYEKKGSDWNLLLPESLYEIPNILSFLKEYRACAGGSALEILNLDSAFQKVEDVHPRAKYMLEFSKEVQAVSKKDLKLNYLQNADIGKPSQNL